MVIDTSALLAVLAGEPEQESYIDAIERDGVRLISAGTYVEAGIVIESRFGPDGSRDMNLFVSEAEIEIVPVTRDQAEIARDAYRAYGRGHHRAGLNFGDCFAYALAKSSGEPLLCKGQDFTLTDLTLCDVVDSQD